MDGNEFGQSRHPGRSCAVIRQCQKTRLYCSGLTPGASCSCETKAQCHAKWWDMENVLYGLTGLSMAELPEIPD